MTAYTDLKGIMLSETEDKYFMIVESKYVEYICGVLKGKKTPLTDYLLYTSHCIVHILYI